MNTRPTATAPGCPGIEPRWTSSAKSGVGTSASPQSMVWFTLSHGIVNEVYYPRLDQANIRDLGLIVTDGKEFFSDEKRHATSVVQNIEPGVPAYRLVNSCNDRRYRLTKMIFTDPRRPCLLQRISFEALVGTLGDYKLFALISPHLANRGWGNDAWVGDYKGWPMLFAEQGGVTLALACSTPWITASCGYVGTSDGWQDLSAHKQLTWQFPEARGGNVALTGEINLGRDGKFVLALAFGRNSAEAGHRARASLLDPIDDLQEEYVEGWNEFQRRCKNLSTAGKGKLDFYRVSSAVMKTHQSKHFVGGLTASLSIPWGFSKSDDDLGGYHLVWSRDQVEAAGALLAIGDTRGALDVLRYLLATQGADGHWPQNMWLDGTPYWHGVQLDEAAFPILLADSLRRERALDNVNAWPAIRNAAGYIIRNGPVTPQDRWEEDGGYSPFTLAVMIAGLLAAADFADEAQEPDLARYIRETADVWNAQIERWTYVNGTALAQKLGIEGYYIRIAPPEVADAASPADGFVPIKNRPPGTSSIPTAQLVSADALALVRFGLRKADSPEILNTVKAIDAVLKCETRNGPVWHRYNDDGYGEHADGSPFDGTGIGRGWTLLAGERAHYELAAGHGDEADRLRKTMESQAGDGGLFPEQVWDAADQPARELFNGRPSGSAMPLVWTHAEYIKLVRSLHDGLVFDTPPQTVQRYLVDHKISPHFFWRFAQKSRTFPMGKILRIETLAPARVRWSPDSWGTSVDKDTSSTGLGIHVADIPTTTYPDGTKIVFTFYWPESNSWEGTDFEIFITG